jgi:glycosyltransferase involved in cell wall biosynthesis
MKVSVVTVCRNAGETIAACVVSVLSQVDADIEYIVIDGQSSDDTLERIRPFANGISQIISEKDAGIYDAMNKGLSLAKGELVGFLNSDDAFEDRHVVAEIVNAARSTGADIVFGDVEFYTPGGRLARIYRARTFRPDLMGSGVFPPHPSFYASTELLRAVGGFDTKFRIAADFDMMMRAFSRDVAWHYLPRTMVKMRSGGASNKGLSSYVEISRELVTACRGNGIQPNLLAIYGRATRKFVELAEGRFQRVRRLR